MSGRKIRHLQRHSRTCTSEDSVWIRTDRNYSYKNISVPDQFVPRDDQERAKRCEEILTIQAMGLKKRLAHTHAKSAVVGISGGLDSTLALLVTAKAFDALGLEQTVLRQ